MDYNNNHNLGKNGKILVPASSYDFKSDKRLLIPFTADEKIGFMNQEGHVIVEAKYNMYYGECYSKTDLIKVTVPFSYGFPRSGDKVAIYTKNLQGLVNYNGEVLKPEYDIILPSIGSKLFFTVQKDHQYAVLDFNGSILIPYGKYDLIDGFDHGLARVLINNQGESDKTLWGIINEKGEELLPLEYDEIWNFYGKNKEFTKIRKGDRSYDVNLNYLDSSICKKKRIEDKPDKYPKEQYGRHFGEFAGLYAQDKLGYSDDLINDAFEGDPDAYWNID